MSPDTGPVTWGYVLGAVLTALLVITPLLLMAYLDSGHHRRRMARVRALTHRPRRTRP